MFSVWLYNTATECIPGVQKNNLTSLVRNERESTYVHSAYSWDRGPFIVVSGKIGFSVSSTDQEPKHILFHLTVDCKVIKDQT